MVQIEHHQTGHDDERRNAYRELRYELFEEYRDVTHLFEPHEVGDETNQPQKKRRDDDDHQNDCHDFSFEFFHYNVSSLTVFITMISWEARA